MQSDAVVGNVEDGGSSEKARYCIQSSPLLYSGALLWTLLIILIAVSGMIVGVNIVYYDKPTTSSFAENKISDAFPETPTSVIIFPGSDKAPADNRLEIPTEDLAYPNNGIKVEIFALTFEPSARPTFEPSQEPTPSVCAVSADGVFIRYVFETPAKVASNTGFGGGSFNGELVGEPRTSKIDYCGCGNALELVAVSNQYANVPSFKVSNEGFSIAMWFRGNNVDVGQLIAFGKSDLDSIVIESQGTNLDFTVSVDSVAMKWTDALYYKVNDNKWRHLVWTLSPDATWTLYMNGQLYRIQEAMNYPFTLAASGINSLGRGYNGALADFRIYNRLVSECEVQQVYQTSSCPAQVCSKPTSKPTSQPLGVPTDKPTPVPINVGKY